MAKRSMVMQMKKKNLVILKLINRRMIHYQH